jgi:signal transduction histidine kinase
VADGASHRRALKPQVFEPLKIQNNARGSTAKLQLRNPDGSASRKHRGSGLGLAICKQIVEAQAGSIGFINNPAGGATFWFEIPYGVPGAGSG